MYFVDYGALATFLHIQDTFSRFSVISFWGTKKKEEQTAEMVKESAISDRMAIFWTPEITMAGKYSIFTGELFQDFCTTHNIVLQTVIPGRH